MSLNLLRGCLAPTLRETLNLILIKVTSLHAKPWVRKQHSPYEEEKKNCLKRISRNECEKEGRQGRLEAGTVSVIYLAGKKLFLSCEGKGKKKHCYGPLVLPLTQIFAFFVTNHV